MNRFLLGILVLGGAGVALWWILRKESGSVSAGVPIEHPGAEGGIQITLDTASIGFLGTSLDFIVANNTDAPQTGTLSVAARQTDPGRFESFTSDTTWNQDIEVTLQPREQRHAIARHSDVQLPSPYTYDVSWNGSFRLEFQLDSAGARTTREAQSSSS